MAVYGIAQITIADRDVYARYEADFMEVFGQFQGRLLAVDEAPQVLEGDWSATRVVLMSFPDEAAFRDWYGSPAYQEIARHRHDGSTGVVLLTKGLPG